jgi:hypothetical protein
MPDTSTACYKVLLDKQIMAVLVSGRSWDNVLGFSARLPAGVAGLTEYSRAEKCIISKKPKKAIGYASLTTATAIPLAVWRDVGG